MVTMEIYYRNGDDNLNKYEQLLDESDKENIFVDENYPFKGNTFGLYIDGNIALSQQLSTSAEKACVLAEELGHHHTTVGNIIDLTNIQNRKQERQARLWAYDKLIGLSGIIRAFEYGCQNIYEIAEYLEVTEEFLIETIECYRDKYGICTTLNNYIIYFIPQLAIGERV